MRLFRLATVVAASGSLAGCVPQRYVVPAPNPEGLSPEALNLRYLVRRGCLPLIRGEKTEAEAMRGVGLYLDKRLSFPDPNPPPTWRGRHAGLNHIEAGRDWCSISLEHTNLADVRRVLATAIGATPERTRGPAARPRSSFIYEFEQYEGCADGVAYKYGAYRMYRHSSVSYEVHLQRANCADQVR